MPGVLIIMLCVAFAITSLIIIVISGDTHCYDNNDRRKKTRNIWIGSAFGALTLFLSTWASMSFGSLDIDQIHFAPLQAVVDRYDNEDYVYCFTVEAGINTIDNLTKQRMDISVGSAMVQRSYYKHWSLGINWIQPHHNDRIISMEEYADLTD